MIFFKFLLVLFNFIWWCIVSISVHHIDENQYILSAFFVVQYILVLYAIWVIGNKRVNIFLLFMFTFGLFLGGRFFAILLGIENRDLFEGTFFAPEIIPWNIGISWINYMNIFLCLSLLGYTFGVLKSTSIKPLMLSKYDNMNIDNILNKLFYIFLFFVIFDRIMAIKLVLAEGYLGLYMNDAEAHSVNFSSIIFSIFLSFCGLAVAYGKPYNKKRYIFLFILWAFATLIAGKRGSLGGVILTLIWLAIRNKNINILKVLSITCFALLGLIGISFLSLRDTYDFSWGKGYQILLDFLFDQGITFAVFGEATNISYTWLHYVGNILPGAGSLIKLFRGGEVFQHEFFVLAHLANSLNSELYSLGYGLGWSILADLFFYAFKIIPIYVVLCWVTGYFMAWLETRLKDCNFIYAFVFSTTPIIFIWARGTIANFTRALFWFLICFLICVIFRTKSSTTKFVGNNKVKNL